MRRVLCVGRIQTGAVRCCVHDAVVDAFPIKSFIENKRKTKSSPQIEFISGKGLEEIVLFRNTDLDIEFARAPEVSNGGGTLHHHSTSLRRRPAQHPRLET